MNTVLKYAIVLLIALPLSAGAQSEKKIKKHKISHYVEKEIDHEDGLKEARIIEESWYNAEGLLIEYKDWDKEGEPKIWEKYTYNTDKTLKEKEELNKKGEFKAKVIYQYENGLIVKKSYFDKKLRLVKEKIYEYEVHQ